MAQVCQECGEDMKYVKGGISKKSGKKYDAFYSCKCGATYNPPKDEAQETVHQEKPHVAKEVNGQDDDLKTRAMVMAYAKDLIVAQINSGNPPETPLKSIIWSFRKLWQEVKAPGSSFDPEEQE